MEVEYENLGKLNAPFMDAYRKAFDGVLESDDFNTLFFYHNRLENFGLTKRVRWDKFPIKMTTRTEGVEI